jgi:hypothetical protein
LCIVTISLVDKHISNRNSLAFKGNAETLASHQVGAESVVRTYCFFKLFHVFFTMSIFVQLLNVLASSVRDSMHLSTKELKYYRGPRGFCSCGLSIRADSTQIDGKIRGWNDVSETVWVLLVKLSRFGML